MTSQSVMFGFVGLRESAGSAVDKNCSRCTGRSRVGVAFFVVCPDRTWTGGTICSTRLHDMTALVVPPHQDHGRARVKRHTSTRHSTAHGVVAHLFTGVAL